MKSKKLKKKIHLIGLLCQRFLQLVNLLWIFVNLQYKSVKFKQN